MCAVVVLAAAPACGNKGGSMGDGDAGPSCEEPRDRLAAFDTECGERTFDEPEPLEGECVAHADCAEGRNGRCVTSEHDDLVCAYDACMTNDDCASGEVCLCGIGRWGENECVRAECTSDADCPGGWCVVDEQWWGASGVFCMTCDDECQNDCDRTGGIECAYGPEGSSSPRWYCAEQSN